MSEGSSGVNWTPSLRPDWWRTAALEWMLISPDRGMSRVILSPGSTSPAGRSRWTWSWAPDVLMSTRPATWMLALEVLKVTGTRPTRSTR